MNQSHLFNIIHSVDSTNNYAMARVHEGLAKHGMAWFAMEQTAGKGQRGRQWHSAPGASIILSIALQPSTVFITNPFYLSAVIALGCCEFLQNLCGEPIKVKWPNDLYWRDRKTGGILIENKYSGNSWNWAVAGIGINLNQDDFPGDLPNPVSLHQITGKEVYDASSLSQQLHLHILEKVNMVTETNAAALITAYNSRLYRKDQLIRLKKANAVFTTTLKKVNDFGQLETSDTIQRIFNFGEVEWLLPPY